MERFSEVCWRVRQNPQSQVWLWRHPCGSLLDFPPSSFLVCGQGSPREKGAWVCQVLMWSLLLWAQFSPLVSRDSNHVPQLPYPPRSSPLCSSSLDSLGLLVVPQDLWPHARHSFLSITPSVGPEDDWFCPNMVLHPFSFSWPSVIPSQVVYIPVLIIISHSSHNWIAHSSQLKHTALLNTDSSRHMAGAHKIGHCQFHWSVEVMAQL